MKNKWEMELGLLRVILGEVATEEARKKKPASDEDVAAVIKKMIKNTRISAHELEAHGRKEDPLMHKLCNELEYLYELMPNKPLMQDSIMLELAGELEAIKAAANEGAALGVAMKHLKQKKCEVISDDVMEVVKVLRK
jgi:uncharacterized protein YqeY